jgi:2'-5' RNA ligase
MSKLNGAEPMSKTGWTDWQKTYEHGTFVIWPPDAVRAEINPLRATYSPIAQSYCETHITLTQPLLCPLDTVDWARLEIIVSSFQSLTIRYGPLRTWSGGRIIYFAIEPQETILALRQALHQTGLFNLDLPFTEGFVPHMTVQEGYAEGTPGADVVEPGQGMVVYQELKDRYPGGAFLCLEITYVVPDSRFHFDVVRTLPFSTATGN